MKKRLEWLDIAKGTGILLVILSHCLHIEGRMFHLIFTFHMPLFLMLSGYVFSAGDSFFVLVHKKIKTLILPFLWFFLLGLAATAMVPEWRQGLTLRGVMSDLWLADPNNVHNSSIWFLVCLFFVTLLFYWLQKFPTGLRFLSLLILYVLGIEYSRNSFSFMGYSRLPLNLDVVPVASVFFALGNYAKSCDFVKQLTQKSSYEITAAILCGAGMCIVCSCNGYVNLHGLSFGHAELYLLGGILGTIAVICTSAWVSRFSAWGFGQIKQVLIWYGKHSLLVLGLQSLLIRLYIVGMAYLFDVQLSLYCFSIKHTMLSFSLVAFIACPIVCLFIDRIRAKQTQIKIGK